MNEALTTERGPYVDPEVIDEIAHMLTRSLFEPLKPRSEESIYRIGAATTGFEVAPLELASVVELDNWRAKPIHTVTQAGYIANLNQVELAQAA